jgi:hypothetical protein
MLHSINAAIFLKMLQGSESAHRTAQVAKNPSINAPTEALNQGSCWRRMGESTTVLFPEPIDYEGKDLCC